MYEINEDIRKIIITESKAFIIMEVIIMGGTFALSLIFPGLSQFVPLSGCIASLLWIFQPVF